MAHLTLLQRQQIAQGIREGKSNARIARELAVSPSTVGREIARNAESREDYTARLAHTMAASRQIQAASDRFRCAAEAYKPSAYSHTFSPYGSLCLPSLATWQAETAYYYKISVCTSAFYFHPKDHYLAFTRFDKVSGQSRPSGSRIIPITMRWDYRVRDTFSSSESFSGSSFGPGRFTVAPSTPSFIAGTADLSDNPLLPVENSSQQTASVCAFASFLSSITVNSPTIPAKTQQIIVPVKSQEGRSLSFAA